MYLQNKYTMWYNSIILASQTRTLGPEIYSEKHHIIPKSLGGSNDSSNLVRLTSKEHFVCHLLLTKMVEGVSRQKMIYAWYLMANVENPYQQRYKTSSRIYEIIRSQAIAAHKEYKHTEKSRRKISIANKGKVRTEEQRTQMSESAKNRVYSEEAKVKRKELGKKHHETYKHSEESRKKISKGNKGKVRTEEHKRKISESLKGKLPWNKGKKHSEETRNKIGEASRNKTMSAEAREKIRNFSKGRTWRIIDGKRTWIDNSP